MSHQDAPPIMTTELAGGLGPQRAVMVRRCLKIAGAGLLIAVGHALLAPEGGRRFALAYLVAFAFVLSLSLGALFFVLIQHLTRAGWSVLVRRLAEALAANMMVVAALFAPIAVTVALGSTIIYPWSVWRAPDALHAAQGDPVAHVQLASLPTDDAHALPAAEAHAAEAPARHDVHHHQHLDELTLKKRPWLSPGMFLLRWVGYFALWVGLGWWYWRESRRQDDDHDPARTVRSERAAGLGLLLFAITANFAAKDLLMSLNPHWFSAVFGVYVFSGAVVGALAMLIVLVLELQRRGVLTEAIGVEHQHDLGKLLFAFVLFWAYIAYSQYMLLWYAHLPETVTWLAHRGASTADPNGWSILLLALLAAHFVVPFAVLMSRHVKRRRGWLAVCAIWLLAAHWLDLLWLVMPELGPGVLLGGVELGLLIAVVGVYVAGLLHRLADGPLVPIGDPRLGESLRFKNI